MWLWQAEPKHESIRVGDWAMIVTAIILAVIAAAVDYFIGIKDPWRKIIYIGIVILLIIGLITFLLPGLLPIRAI